MPPLEEEEEDEDEQASCGAVWSLAPFGRSLDGCTSFGFEPFMTVPASRSSLVRLYCSMSRMKMMSLVPWSLRRYPPLQSAMEALGGLGVRCWRN